jgi:hypothetical protein
MSTTSSLVAHTSHSSCLNEASRPSRRSSRLLLHSSGGTGTPLTARFPSTWHWPQLRSEHGRCTMTVMPSGPSCRRSVGNPSTSAPLSAHRPHGWTRAEDSTDMTDLTGMSGRDEKRTAMYMRERTEGGSGEGTSMEPNRHRAVLGCVAMSGEPTGSAEVRDTTPAPSPDPSQQSILFGGASPSQVHRATSASMSRSSEGRQGGTPQGTKVSQPQHPSDSARSHGDHPSWPRCLGARNAHDHVLV